MQEPSNGVVELGHNVTLGYFAQEHEQIDPALTALENVSDAVLTMERERRALLGSFGLPSKAADQLPGSLSGGERAKLGLAMLSAGVANVLLLDEPTNNLDPASRAEILAALRRYQGAIVLVTHDEGAVEALSPERVILLPDGVEDTWNEGLADLVTLA